MIRYAKSFVDELYDRRDIFALDSVIEVIERNRKLPEQFWLFRRLLAWGSWSRSGIWQYYEAISQEDFAAVASALERFRLVEFADRYRSGMATWKPPNYCDDLDRWIDLHWSELENTVFQLIHNDRGFLYGDR
jgi:hypothetical protein